MTVTRQQAEHEPVARVLPMLSVPHLDREFDYLVPADLSDDAQPGVRAKVDTVEAAMSHPQVSGLDLRARTAGYMKTTLGTVIPFYRLEKAGGFKDADPRGAAFVTERLAAGASELRDLIILSWRESGTASIGWPAVKVAEVEAGAVDPWTSMIGED